jgi:predicted small secreted protein
MRQALVLLVLFVLAGCTSSIGFGDDDGVGIKGSLGKDGRIVCLEPTDGEGNPRK